ncbi:hypothetical protein TTHERM_00790950 (macronuclear) [Tetrahymena thermophila SB210]|uniref:Uncharacterized protein n=1 Tax=Tetrahymena thermophila (strain SB210) TaxID=312017 RepID=Q24DP2_TETTS|nr:hypothetical protein TTHERM_00790950 [Tetrahymena thermophila SB210]EAS05948.2 hypothetical protein TTHERM_00790950 [Tetrahymena thermophila SB210]|eukprot:XP_001026193.2 hypothetical protein TTHERM_00790950 [Tetrahymena thermophila SB210]
MIKDSSIKNTLGQEQDFYHKKPSEIQLMNENKTLKKEVAFLDNINLRLGKELTELQVKFNIHPGQFKPFRPEDTGLDQSKFAYVNRELSFLEPLLNAYDDKIQKMERLLETVYDDFRDMEKKADYLIQDNNNLREQLEQKCQLILSIYKDGPIIDNMGNAFLKLERDDLNERINLLSEENKELFAKFQEISSKYNEMNRRYEDQLAAAQKSLTQHSEISEHCKKLQIEYDQIKHQKDVLENRLKQCIESQAFAEGEKSDLQSKLNRTENEIKILKTQVSNLKRNSGDMEEKKNNEIEQLKREVDQVKTKDRESFQKLITMEKELDFIKDENRRLLKESETLKNQQEEMMRMMDNYQSKIQTYEKKEENNGKLQKEQREKLQEALLEKDKAVLREQQIEKTLRTLNENHRQELNEIKEQYERLVDTLKQNHKQILEEREDEIHQINEQLNSANFIKDKLQKENNTLQQEYKKITHSLGNEYGGNQKDQVAEYERRISELEEKLQLAEQYHNDRLHSLQMEKAQIETSYKNQQNIINDLKSSNERYRQEAQKYQMENAQMSSKVNASQKERQTILEEINKTKKLFENKLDYAQNQFNFKMKDIQDQLNESLKRERTTREKAIELFQAHERAEDKMKYEYESRIKELDNFVQKLQEENKVLQQKVRKIVGEYPSKDK